MPRGRAPGAGKKYFVRVATLLYLSFGFGEKGEGGYEVGCLRHMSYYRDTYLKSEQWQQLKRLKASKTPKRCAICGDTSSIDLHHLFYRANLNDAETSDLRWLCRRCHTKAHELIDMGLIKFKPHFSHHAMFCVTKSKVNQYLGKSRIRIDNECEIAKHIDSFRSGKCSWNRKALEQLGVAWPPKKGWRKELIRAEMMKQFGH